MLCCCFLAAQLILSNQSQSVARCKILGAMSKNQPKFGTALYTVYIYMYIYMYIMYTMHVHAQRSNVVQLHGAHAPAWRLRLAQFSSLCFLLGEQPVTEIESLWRTNSAEQINLRSSHPIAACSNLSRI